jgi:predicted secreted acid phosphatase
LANLQKFNLPNSDNAHLIMRKDVSSKEIRRQEVLKNYHILLYLGDNLADFHALYDVKGAANRLAATNQLLAEFGDKFHCPAEPGLRRLGRSYVQLWFNPATKRFSDSGAFRNHIDKAIMLVVFYTAWNYPISSNGSYFN